MNRQIIFMGECRSYTAIKKGWSWQDGRLAAKPLFEALAALGIDPAMHLFYNAFRDPPARRNVQRWKPTPNDGILSGLHVKVRGRIVVALGQRVSKLLTERGIEHVALVHPAARGRIRKRSRYIKHVADKLGPVLR